MSKNKDNNKRIERDLLRNKLLHSTWLRGVIAAAGVVVFCTVYALILPAAATTSGNDADDYSTMGAVDGFNPEGSETGTEAGSEEGTPSEGTEVALTDGSTDPSADENDPAGNGSGDVEDGTIANPTPDASQDGTVQETASQESVPENTQNTDVSGNNTDTQVVEIKSAIPENGTFTVVSEVVDYTEMDEEAQAGFDESVNTIEASLAATGSVSDNSVTAEASEQAEIQTETSVSDNATAEASSVTNAAAAETQSETTTDTETIEVENAEVTAVAAEGVDAETNPEAQTEIVEEIPVVYAHDLSGDANGISFTIHAEDVYFGRKAHPSRLISPPFTDK